MANASSLSPPGSGGRTPTAKPKAGPATAAGIVFLVLALGAFAAWASSNLPYSPLARPEVLAAESVRLLEADEPRQAAEIIRRELDLRPYDASAWCRMAASQLAISRRLDPQVQDLLQRSYAASAIDVEAFAWRSALIFNHWSEVSPHLRKAAVDEVRAMDGIWETRPQVAKLADAVRDPTGNLALAIIRKP